GCEPWQLLQRRPDPLDEESISKVLTGRRMLIPGVGGSIGSQLALGAAAFKPSKLVLVERHFSKQDRMHGLIQQVQEQSLTACCICRRTPSRFFGASI
ncbi:MAG TPA: hypothetical protein EYP57_01095, partial [Thermodesulfobacteriaceae bacterium]|nr:hypothetical protein [Thermodesulfobacteriaceae bacterium]